MGMVTPAGGAGSLPDAGFRRLTPPERRIATRQYAYWCWRLGPADGPRPGAGCETLPQVEPNVARQAMNLVYIGVARFWLGLAGPVAFVAAGFWSFRDSATQEGVAMGLSVVATTFTGAMALRWSQSRGFWPDRVVPPPQR